MADVSKLAYAKYQPIHGKFKENFEKVKSVLMTKLSSSLSRYASLVIADSLFGLTKEDRDKENDMWELKEFEDLLLFIKVLKYSLIVGIVMILRVYITLKFFMKFIRRLMKFRRKGAVFETQFWLFT